MFKNYLITAYRNLLRFKLDSVLNISGLVIGLTAALLIVLFIRHEVSYDKFWQDSERLYRVQTHWVMEGREDIRIVNSPGPLKAALQAYFPNEIETGARLFIRRPVVYRGADSWTDTVTFADPEIFDIFDFEIIKGDARAALNDNASIVLSETLARKYFGETDPIGQTLTLDNRYLKRDYRVLAVMSDLPLNTHLDIDALIKLDESDYVDNDGSWMFGTWNSASNHTYIKLREGANIEPVIDQMDAFTDAHLEVSTGKASDRNKFPVLSVPDIHLYSDAAGSMRPDGDIQIVYSFAIIALLIVIVATINYINLSTARAGQRAKEISIRKVMGATRTQLVFQQLGESTLIVGLALLLTLLAGELALPFFNQWLNLSLDLTLGDPLILVSLVVVLVVVGGLSGFYPALILSSGKPANSLRASGPNTNPGTIKIRNALVVFQTAVTVALIVATTVVYAQLTYFRWLDRGFEPEQLVVIQGMGNTGMRDKRGTFRELVANLPNVKAAALSYESPTNYYENNTRLWFPGGDEADSYSIGSTRVDPNYLEALDIPLLAGRFFRTDVALDRTPDIDGYTGESILQHNIVINERAVSALGLGTAEQAIGRVVETRFGLENGATGKAHHTIVGVIGNTKLHSVKRPVRQEIYNFDDDYFFLLVRYTGAGTAVLANIQTTWSQMMPGEPFEYFYVDQVLAEEFQSETNQANIFLSFAVLTMVVGCLGLYGLAAFVTECRRREIGIRKILGARIRDILTLLFSQFSWLVLVANLIAWPVAYLLMSDWLAQYPFRIEGFWIFVFCLLSGLLSSAVVAITVSSQAWDVARSSPIEAIHHE
ncbi:MAG: ABC transporter permease [Xanthomonadales bacterium]|nr:ABC transporter permease [Xanthomonadales bacterium]